MVTKKEVQSDGIFQKVIISCTRKDTPLKSFASATKKMLMQAGRVNTTKYLFATLEANVKKCLKTPKSISRKKEVRESDERRRRDCEKILEQIKFLRAMPKDAETDFLQVRFFYLGALVQRANIRLIEPDAMRGIKIIKSAQSGGESKAMAAESRHDQWVADAVEIQEQKPTYSKWRIAGFLEDKYKDDPELAAKKDTIWRVIK